MLIERCLLNRNCIVFCFVSSEDVYLCMNSPAKATYVFAQQADVFEDELEDFNEFLIKNGQPPVKVMHDSDTDRQDHDQSDQDEKVSAECHDVDTEEEFIVNGILETHDFLGKLASVYLRKGLYEIDGAIKNALPAQLTVASLCAGSGTGEITFTAAVNCLSDYFLTPIQSKVVLCCEREAWKQNHLISNVVGPDTCVFDDVCTLGALADKPVSKHSSCTERPKVKPTSVKEVMETSQWCVQHKKSCALPPNPVSLLKSGFSCKGNSRMNQKFSEFRTSMQSGDFSNCSISTFYGTLGVVQSTQPRAFVLENVDSIGSESQDSNLSRVLTELQAVDAGAYATRVYRLCTHDFLLPQSRPDIIIESSG